ncbi:MAG: lamin tail domain-containing protein, partial [Archangium sp.]|nr:lamin tail domain-containing protein [Archangium sp.]
TGGGAGGGTSTDDQIAAVRTAAETITDGGVIGLPITGALVTYLKPLALDAGTADPAGFFIQSSQNGPALFVAIDPATVSGGPFVPGDLVDITVQTVARLPSNNVRAVVAVTSATKSSSGNPISGLRAAIDAVDFLAAGQVDLFESRLITVTATIVGDPVASIAGYKAASISTAGTPDGGSNFRLRLPTALMDSLILGPGCTFSLNGAPLWRSFNAAQPSTWSQSELTNLTCPAPASVSAFSTSNTAATVLFSRDLTAASVTTGAFTVASTGGSLAVSAATVLNSRAVALTTAAQTAGTTYTVTVANTVTDSRGTAVGSGNTATFTGLAAPVCNSGLVISAIYGGGGNTNATYTHDYVELKNRTAAPINLAGWSLQYASSAGTNFSTTIPLTGTIPANGYFMLRGNSNAAVGIALPTTHDQDAPTLTLSGTAGVLALVASTAPLTGCPATGTVADLVGYGTASSTCREMAPTATLSSTTAAFRAGAGCTDANANNNDFAVAMVSSQAPRNTASAAVVCSCP